MIKKLVFDNFKCLSNKEFNLSKINFFTGYNGRGKSSVIQSLILLSQSTRKDDANGIEYLHVNGNFIQLGDFYELLANEDEYGFVMEMDLLNGSEHKVKLGYEMTDDFKVGRLNTCIIDGTDWFDIPGTNPSEFTKKGDYNKRELTKLPNFLNEQFLPHNVHYVAADRIGPVKFVEKEEKPDFYYVGSNGSKTINILSTYADTIDPRMNVNVDDKVSHTLEESVTAWVQEIMHGGSVSVKGTDKTSKEKFNKRDTSAVLELGFGLGERTFNSYNVGFGYSYILSIVVTTLIAKEGNIVIIENPEAHLHPEAQVRLTYLLAKLASRNVQVFVETHSEHVINGIRLAVLKQEYKLDNEDVKIFFFDHDYSKIDLVIKKNGRIPNWPERFFDQYQHELAEIMKLGANVKE